MSGTGVFILDCIVSCALIAALVYKVKRDEKKKDR